MKFKFSRQIFEEVPNTKFHQNPSSGSRVVACGQTDMAKLINSFRNVVNTPKSDKSCKEFICSSLGVNMFQP
jgi:hypothetical protein